MTSEEKLRKIKELVDKEREEVKIKKYILNSVFVNEFNLVFVNDFLDRIDAVINEK